jgi:hypothetical protein
MVADMSSTSCKLYRNWVALAITGVATLGLVTACAGSGPSHRDNTVAESRLSDGGIAASEGAPEAPPQQEPAPVDDVTRDVIKTASMTISVANTSEAADKAAVMVEDADGRVDSRSENAGSDRGFAQTSVVLRVPAAKLDGVVRELKTLGTVQSAQTTAEDVTAQRVDLDARIKALQTSVERLLAIMRDATDPDALITAEDALSQRQADLDSLRAQREALGDRIEYSTIDVTFMAQTIGGPAPKEYQGFGGQVERGWDNLVFVVGNLVLLFGLMLPWLTVMVIVVGLLFGLFKLVGSRGTKTPPVVNEPAEGSDVDVAKSDSETNA